MNGPVVREPSPPRRLVGLEWQRVQLLVAIQEAADARSSPRSLRLTRNGRRSAEAVEPMAEDRIGDRVSLRFNVIRGSGRHPLDRGRWTLTESLAGRSRPVRLGVTDATRTPVTTSFRLTHLRYDATAAFDADRGELTVTIATDPFDGRIPRHWPFWRVGRRQAIEVKQAVIRSARRATVAAARRTTHRTGRRIVFASAGRASLTGNLQVVRDRMIERGLDADYELVRLGIRTPGGPLDRLRARWRSARLLLGAEAILVAGSRQRAVYGLGYDPDVRFIQLWHASGAFKTVGFSRPSQPDAPDPYAHVHREYTHAVVSSDHDAPFYAEAFGIPESRLVPIGIPRMDRFFDERSRSVGRAAALAAFPMIADHLVWLFAPTYRGRARAATYAMDRIDFAGLHALAAERDAVVLFKMHPFVTAAVPIPAPYNDRLVDGTRTTLDVNDLLFAVDLLITDYSSIVFEYSVLERPMLFYAYDLDEYIAERDFYVPFEAFVPGRIVRTSEELLDAIRREDYDVEKVRAFVAAHFAHLDGHATDRIIDELVLAR